MLLSQQDTNAATRELTQIERQLAATYKRGDCDGWAALLAPEWSVTHITGEVITRAQAIETCKSGAIRLESLESDELSVRVFGNAAVVTGRTTASTGGASPATVRLRFTDVFIRQSGKWLVVASHATRLN
jgi:ketosteroid isomerase-like protein